MSEPTKATHEIPVEVKTVVGQPMAPMKELLYLLIVVIICVTVLLSLDKSVPPYLSGLIAGMGGYIFGKATNGTFTGFLRNGK